MRVEVVDWIRDNHDFETIPPDSGDTPQAGSKAGGRLEILSPKGTSHFKVKPLEFFFGAPGVFAKDVQGRGVGRPVDPLGYGLDYGVHGRGVHGCGR